MTYIKEYWSKKEQNAKKALEHTNEMKTKYEKEILDSIKNSKIYDTDFVCKKNEKIVNTCIGLNNNDSVSTIFNHAKGKTAILNFSSYKNPGGMFIKGSKAQEECLCHESFLYNVLSQLEKEFYVFNRTRLNKALYLNRAIYSPDIVFERDKYCVKCDVITCAAPNKSAAQEYQKVSNEENTKVLKSRIKYILDIAKENDVNTLILGAYGCGVFGQDAIEVATIFKEYLDTTYKCFDKVVFAIIDSGDKNFKKFETIFN